MSLEKSKAELLDRLRNSNLSLISRKSGVAYSTIHNIASGKADATSETFIKIEKALDEVK